MHFRWTSINVSSRIRSPFSISSTSGLFIYFFLLLPAMAFEVSPSTSIPPVPASTNRQALPPPKFSHTLTNSIAGFHHAYTDSNMRSSSFTLLVSNSCTTVVLYIPVLSLPLCVCTKLLACSRSTQYNAGVVCRRLVRKKDTGLI